METGFLVPGGPRQGPLWSRDMSPIQAAGEAVCVFVWSVPHPCFTISSTAPHPWTLSWAILEYMSTAQWVLTGVSERAVFLVP